MRTKPKILFVTPLPPPVHGSSMVSKSILESELVNHEFDVDSVNISTSRKMSEIGKFPISKLWRYAMGVMTMLWKLLTQRYDLIYLAITVNGIGFIKDFPYIVLARIFCKRIVIHQHNKGMAPFARKRVFGAMLRYAYKNAKVILLSERLYADISEVVSREQVMVCPNGLQLQEVLDAEDVRRNDSPQPSPVHLLYLSNLIESKGVYALLDACRILKDRGYDFTCSFIGGESKQITQALFAQAVTMRQLEAQITYYGPKYGSDKEVFWQSADVFVFPTFYYNECFPLVVLEAMQHGVPVVTTDEGGIPDMVTDGETGFLVSAQNIRFHSVDEMLGHNASEDERARSRAFSEARGTELADRLEQLLTNPELRKKMGHNGYNRYRKHFTNEVFERRMCECLKHAIYGFKRQATCLIAFLLAVTLQAANISIRTQAEFDALSATIKRAVAQGEKEIIIDIQTDQLTFSERQINLRGINASDVSILIRGNGVQLTGTGRYVTRLSHPDRMYLRNGQYYNPWTEFRSASDTIHILDAARHLCQVETRTKNTKNRHPKDCYIQYTCWYTSQISPIKAIGKRSISFDGGEWAVTHSGNFCNVNLDYAYARTTPRYRLFGTKRLPKLLYECSASTLLQLESCRFRSFVIQDIHTVGSNAGNPLIFFNSCQADSICVTGSDFSCIGGTLLLCRNTRNVCFTDNHVNHAMGISVRDEYGCRGTRVTGNVFRDCGLAMSNTMVVLLNGDNFTVSHNVISDFCYGGIGVGIWGGSSTQAKCSGIVSGNELFYTERFLRALDQNTLMDSGAIYVWTRTDGITITDNYIHDISGMKDNRGIFCDDGTKNVTVANNKIERIANSYDIDLRLCDGYKNQVPDYNTGNYIHGNQTTGKVRFEQK